MPLRRLIPLAMLFTGCVTPAPPAERVTDAAQQLNLATRFGRMDVAAQKTAESARSHFISRHKNWGSELRVVDVEMAGLEMKDAFQASVLVDVSWVPIAESTLRTTRLVQTWRDDGGGWLLVREKRVSGDPGLFGKPQQKRTAEARRDVHFRTRTIR